MDHWRTALPRETFLEVNYEDLVADKEKLCRQILEFCDLDWNDAVLSHEHNESAIRTPSKWQARQPIYSGSIDRWKRYEPWLLEIMELRDELNKYS